MATPSGTFPTNLFVIIEIITGGSVKPNSTSCGFGEVKAISPSVTEVSVGQDVFFKNGSFYSVVGGDVFAVVDQKDIMFIKTAVP